MFLLATDVVTAYVFQVPFIIKLSPYKVYIQFYHLMLCPGALVAVQSSRQRSDGRGAAGLVGEGRPCHQGGARQLQGLQGHSDYRDIWTIVIWTIAVWTILDYRDIWTTRTFIIPLFTFAFESYIYETDFSLGLSQKYHF